MSDKINPRAVLSYLNELGYNNISAEQLKEFMKDLKKLIKYEKRKAAKENFDNVPSISPINFSRCNTTAQRSRSLSPPRSPFMSPPRSSFVSPPPSSFISPPCACTINPPPSPIESTACHTKKKSLNKAPSVDQVASKNSVEQAKENVIRIIVKTKGVSDDCDCTSKQTCLHPTQCKKLTSKEASKAIHVKPKQFSEQENQTTNIPKINRSTVPLKSAKFSSNVANKHELPSCSRGALRFFETRPRTTSDVNKCPTKSMTSRSSFIHARKPLKMSKSDPVALYHQYQQHWSKCKIPGEESHKRLRWNIREKVLGGESTKSTSAAPSVEVLNHQRQHYRV